MSSKWKSVFRRKKDGKEDPIATNSTSVITSGNRLPKDASDSLHPLPGQTVSTYSIQCTNEVVIASSSGVTADSTYRNFKELFRSGQIYGLTVLHNPAYASTDVVDIIFIHGLNGHPYKTWLDAKSGTYWPVDLLPHNVPNARIMAFGYDAGVTNVVGPVGQNNIRDHASTLLGDLARVRGETNSNDRKIVFIVHSLGGLVIKEALCKSDRSRDHHLKQADRCTVGIAFLGTPHRGSELATLANVIANTFKIVMRANTDVLRGLKSDSKVLAEIEDSFAEWLGKKGVDFNITCFYEELQLPAVGFVVTKVSARISGYPRLSIHANHMDMARFRNQDDIGYKRIAGELERWLSPFQDCSAGLRKLTRDEQDCLKSLSFIEMNDRGNDIGLASEGTCAWLLDHETYIDWLSQSRGLLWIRGNPGVGKSTLVKYALQSIERRQAFPLSNVAVLSFFFHGRGAEIQKTPIGLFRSLLHQLLERFPSLLSNIVQTFQERSNNIGQPGEKWTWHWHELQRFLETALPKILERCAIRIMVDALDECGKEAAIEFVDWFQRLHLRCSPAKHGLSICFSCRHYPILSIDKGSEICVEHENHNDIENYIRTELQKKIPIVKDLERLQSAIFSRSSYVFQWVALVVKRSLSQYMDGSSLEYILEMLKKTPLELDSLYEDIIQNLGDNEETLSQSLQLLQWIYFARRPLSLTELRFAMIVGRDTDFKSLQECKESSYFIEDDEKMLRKLKSLSGGLAEVKEHEGRRKAQFIHQSVNDYLLKKGLRILQTSSETENTFIGSAHLQLSRSCIRYIAMGEIQQHQGKDAQFLQKEFPFLDYTVMSWLSHAEVVEANGIHQRDLLEFWRWPSSQMIRSWARIYFKIDIFPYGFPDKETTLLHEASKNGLISVVRAILDNLECLNLTTDSEDNKGRRPLSLAAKSREDAVVKQILGHSAYIESKDSLGRTPLSWAAENGNEAVVKLLLEHGADIESKDSLGRTPLSWAAKNGNEAVVKLLLEHGADIESKDSEYGQTPLSWGAENGEEVIVKLLLEHGADIESKDYLDRTPLSWAAENGYDAVVKSLLEKDASIETQDFENRTPMMLAVARGRQAVVELLESGSQSG